MTDLTEQWKRGEFIICNAGKCQYYYVQNEEQREVIKTEYCLFDDNTPNWQILAPVPTFEELENMNKAVNECMAANIKLVEQNKRLKELLKECLAHLTIGKYGTSVTPINILCDEIEEVQDE